MDDLYSKLAGYDKENWYPMHMPGHKRNTSLTSCINPYTLDITEIDGFDNLHHATGVLKDGMKLAAQCFHADRTFYLVNGSSSGILIGIFAATKPGDTVLIARNCHKAVYHAIELRGLVPIYLMPETESKTGICKGICQKAVEEQLIRHKEIKLVVITSPTYEGIISDVAAIVRVVHSYGIPIFVDEAHGAHLGFHPDFFQNSNYCGADLVVQSVHKTLPSLTQTALLHCNGTMVSATKVEEYSAIFQTSSPSYLLMGSIDSCVRLLLQQGQILFEQFSKRLREFYKSMESLKVISVMKANYDTPDNRSEKTVRDPSKIVILTENITMTGLQLYDILRRDYFIQPEMAAGNYVLCMTSIADTQEGFQRLSKALHEIDLNLQEQITSDVVRKHDSTNKTDGRLTEEGLFESSRLQSWPPMRSMPAEQAKRAVQELTALAEAENKVVGDYIYLYPPGIPILVPGEMIGREEIEIISKAVEQGLHVYGLSSDGRITTVR